MLSVTTFPAESVTVAGFDNVLTCCQREQRVALSDNPSYGQGAVVVGIPEHCTLLSSSWTSHHKWHASVPSERLTCGHILYGIVDGSVTSFPLESVTVFPFPSVTGIADSVAILPPTSVTVLPLASVIALAGTVTRLPLESVTVTPFWSVTEFIGCTTGFPLEFVTTFPATSVTAFSTCVAGFPFVSVTTLPLLSVTATKDWVTGFPFPSVTVIPLWSVTVAEADKTFISFHREHSVALSVYPSYGHGSTVVGTPVQYVHAVHSCSKHHISQAKDPSERLLCGHDV